MMSIWRRIRKLFSKDWVEATVAKPYSIRFGLAGEDWFEWTGQVIPVDGGARKGAVLSICFYGRAGRVVPPKPSPHWLSSEKFAMFKYLDTRGAHAGATPHVVRADIPVGAVSAQITILPWHATPELRVSAQESIFWGCPVPPGLRNETDGGYQDADGEQDSGEALNEEGFTKTAALEIRPSQENALWALTVLLDPQVDIEKAGLVVVRYFDHDGEIEEITNVRPFTKGGVGIFRYLDGNQESDADSPNVFIFTPPLGVTRMEFEVRSWKWEGREILAAPIKLVAEDEIADVLLSLPDCRNKWRALADWGKAVGNPVKREQALAQLLEIAPHRNVMRELEHSRATLAELELEWVPGGSNPAVSQVRSPLLKKEDGLRICHLMKVSRAFENSGGAVRNNNTVKYQRHRGLQPYVILPLGYPRDSYHETSVVGGVTHFHLPLGGLAESQVTVTSELDLEIDAATSIVEQMGVDVIHATSGYRGYETALKGMALARRFDVPFVYEVRSFHEHTWGSRTEAVTAPLTRMRMEKELFCMEQADHVITISEAMRDELEERGVARKKISVIPNAVDDDFLEYKDDGRSAALREQLGWADKTVIGYISNISAREGHSVLIDAIAELLQTNDQVRCLIVGAGRKSEEIEAYSASLGLSGKVLFTGEIDHKEIFSYYKAIDYFVVPRVPDYAADFVTPMKPFEAMALKVPLVMSDRPVAQEILGNDERGWSFKTGDPIQLADTLKAIMAHPQETKARVEAAFDWVAKERRWKNNSADFVRIYRSLSEVKRSPDSRAEV